MTDQDRLAEYRQAVASDLGLLARLHAEEPNAELLNYLRAEEFPRRLGLRLSEPGAIEAMEWLEEALAQPFGPTYLDQLAVDFADIYLNHTLRVSPCESVWFDEEGLERQAAMFEVREIYKSEGVRLDDRRDRGEDHLVPQLDFIAHLIGNGRLERATEFMDHHLLRWLPRFADGIVERCKGNYYRGLALLTAHYLEQVREHLALILNQPRPDPEELERELAQRRPQEELPPPCNMPINSPSF
jgi:TorA maturation chaperone TorD